MFDPETGKTINRFNGTSYFEKNKLTEKQLVYLAKKNAQEKNCNSKTNSK